MAIQAYGAQTLVLSLGVDMFEGDPTTGISLKCNDYLRIGERLMAAGLPTVPVLVGACAIDEMGVNAVNMLQAIG